MAPRPSLIFQKISPSVWLCTFADVQSAGLGGGSAVAAGPSPLPLAPWQVTQLVSTVFWALPTPLTGFFRALASAGAFHSPPWAQTIPAPAPTSRAAANTTARNLESLLMTPPFVS